jgi:hypothetical protein
MKEIVMRALRYQEFGEPHIVREDLGGEPGPPLHQIR